MPPAAATPAVRPASLESKSPAQQARSESRGPTPTAPGPESETGTLNTAAFPERPTTKVISAQSAGTPQLGITPPLPREARSNEATSKPLPVRTPSELPKPIPTIQRQAVVEARSRELTRTLNDRKNGTSDRQERARINSTLRRVQDPSVLMIPDTSKFTDLQGNAIGKVSRRSVVQDPQEIVLGSSRFIRWAAFDFTMPRQTADRVRPQAARVQPVLRFTAYLSEDAIPHLKKFIVGELQERNLRTEHGTRVVRPSAKEIRKRFLEDGRKTFDFTVGGIEVHCNLDGKVEIFSPLRDASINFIERSQLRDNRLVSRLAELTRFSRLKAWVSHTSQPLNEQVKGGFGTLARALSHILPADDSY